MADKNFQENFIKAVRLVMANENIESLKDAAEVIGFNYMSLYKIMDRSNNPTADQGIQLCNYAGYNANWLFLNKGEVYYKDELEAARIMKELKAIRKEVSAAING